jgi:uncharacterized protein (TIGR00299 family) protein
MSLAYFDCFAGSGGDMIVGALVDAGAGLEALRAAVGKLPLEGVELSAERVRRGGLAGRHFRVGVPHHHADDEGPGHRHGPHRHLGDILAMIDAADLPDRAAQRARRIFTRLGEAEAKVHHIDIERVHFHEVGAVDSIVDIVGACVALELLDVEEVHCSAIPLGRGTAVCEHGRIPIPAPATAELVVGAETVPGVGEGELTTPTAAAVLTTLAAGYGPPPAMRVVAVGCGAGTRTEGPLPNLLRVLIGEAHPDGETDTVVELSANVDDCTGELIGAALGRLLDAGCLDAWAAPIVMKKSRPAWTVSALCAPRDVPAAERILFGETTTFGVRRRACERAKLRRSFETVETPYGPIRVKVARRGRRVLTAAAEFDDCDRAAQSHHVPVKEVQAAAEAAFRQAERRGE